MMILKGTCSPAHEKHVIEFIYQNFMPKKTRIEIDANKTELHSSSKWLFLPAKSRENRNWR